MRGEVGGIVGGAASRAFGAAFGAKGAGIEIIERLVLSGSCGCHAGSAAGFRHGRSVPAVRISCVWCDCSRLELCHFGVASITSVQLLCRDVWPCFNSSELFLQGQCWVSQTRGWHLQNQSPWLFAIQLLKETARCPCKMCCSTLHPGLSDFGFYLPCWDLHI